MVRVKNPVLLEGVWAGFLKKEVKFEEQDRHFQQKEYQIWLDRSEISSEKQSSMHFKI